jgi:hypothetical protein
MRFRRLAIGVASAMVISGSAVAFLPAGAAFATYTHCVQGQAYVAAGPQPPNLQTVGVCDEIVGTSNLIDTMSGWAYEDPAWGPNYPVYDVHIQLIWPNGNTIQNCKSQTLGVSSSTSRCTWAPYIYYAPGAYCVVAWQYWGGGYVYIGKSCINT